MSKILTLEEFLTESDIYINDDMYEAMRRDSQVVAREQEARLKASIEKYGDLMKKHPERAGLYKAQVELAVAKQEVLRARAKVAQMKNSLK